MGEIFAIGGGSLIDQETLEIDQEIVHSTGKENPKALFIPTASEDDEEYIDNFKHIYGEKLGCQTDALLLTKNPNKEDLNDKIQSSDLIYVGGGNTRKMINIWKKRGLDKLLKKAYNNGTILSGLSAGGICWFENGHSDSESYETEDSEWSFIQVEGINIVEDIIFCPHYHEENREEDFQEMMKKEDKIGLAVDNNTAAHIKEGKLEIMKSGSEGKAYLIYGEKPIIRELNSSEKHDIQKLNELL